MELPPIVDVPWVLAHREGVVLADVRWYLDGRSGSAAFAEGHIPGAIFVDLDHDLSTPGEPAEGRHPLPSSEDFAAALGRLGTAAETPVVAYDDSGGGSAGRLVWMLRVLGRPAAMLDGGLRAWPEPPETGSGREPTPVDVAPAPWPADRFVGHETVASAAAGDDVVVLDARSAPRFRGEVASVDTRRGHIPGAANAPWADNLDPASCQFRATDDLRAHYRRLGVNEETAVIGYCGSGVSSCADLLALEHLGVRHTRLYVPSWSGWTADPARPAATGAE